MTLPGPLPIADYFDALRAAGLEIVPGSLAWLPDKEKPGQWIAAVDTRPVAEDATPYEDAPEGVRK